MFLPELLFKKIIVTKCKVVYKTASKSIILTDMI